MAQYHKSPFAAILMLLFILINPGCGKVFAQRFAVTKFTSLPNDISAFVNPVRDLNGEACAVVKIAAPDDFAFSTPLGIVKRKDKVGEIWLYLPRGSKMMTIKHPQWGVLRDFRFPSPLESRMTYELTLNLPEQDLTVKYDTIVLTKTVTDTITIKNANDIKPKVPLALHALVTVSMHTNGPSFGIMFAIMKRHGMYVHARSDLKSIGTTVATCDRDGYTDNSGIKPYYTWRTRRSNVTVTAGPTHSLSRMLNLFYGVGYGRSATAWQLAESEGGGYALNNGLTRKGIAAEAGLLIGIGRISAMASASTIKGKVWQGTIGVGIKIGKR